MKSSRLRPLLVVLAVLCALAASGCTTMNPDETTMPWTRQQDWENQGPGVPGGGFR